MEKDYAFEMSCYRYILAVKWQDRRTNEGIRSVVHRKETMVDTIRMRKLQLFGHICRMPDDRLLKTLLFGIVEGERRPGRPARSSVAKISEMRHQLEPNTEPNGNNP